MHFTLLVSFAFFFGRHEILWGGMLFWMGVGFFISALLFEEFMLRWHSFLGSIMMGLMCNRRGGNYKIKHWNSNVGL